LQKSLFFTNKTTKDRTSVAPRSLYRGGRIGRSRSKNWGARVLKILKETPLVLNLAQGRTEIILKLFIFTIEAVQWQGATQHALRHAAGQQHAAGSKARNALHPPSLAD
jgi:hypothetical protein